MPALHPFIPVPGVIRLALEGVVGGRPFANVFHATYTGGPPTAPVLLDYADTWYDTVTAALAAIAGTSVTYSQVVATDLSSLTGAEVIGGAPVPGGLAGTIIPSNAAVLINYNSSFRYRGGHPRTYLIGGVELSLQTVNEWTDAFVTSCGAAMGTIQGAFAAGGEGGFVPTGQCAVSYRQAGEPVTAPDGYRLVPLVMPISTYHVSPGVATMRRRMRK
jgi:hypothetical protein